MSLDTHSSSLRSRLQPTITQHRHPLPCTLSLLRLSPSFPPSLSHSLTHSPSVPLSLTPPSLPASLFLSLPPSLTLSLTLSLTVLSLTFPLSLTRPLRYSIVEGTHPLWGGVSEPYKHMIRSFLVHFQLQILSQVSEEFNFRNGSIGNFFFAGSRTFFRSLESAVFLFR